MREQLGLRLGTVREMLLERRGDAGVDLPAPAPEQAAVGGVLYERVL